MNRSRSEAYQNKIQNETIFEARAKNSLLDVRIERKLKELKVRREQARAFRFMCKMLDFFRWNGRDVDLRGYK